MPKEIGDTLKTMLKHMYLMLQQTQADDYVIATGETYSIKDFINKMFRLFKY
jgi:GDPmannose 4,6-dehydratase